MSLLRARLLIRLQGFNASKLRPFSSSRRSLDEADDLIKKMLMDFQREQRLNPSGPPEDSEWNVVKDLQSLNGPHLDQFIQKFLDKTKGEELEFEMLATKLSEAISIFEGKDHPALEGTKKGSETAASVNEDGKEIEAVDEAQSSMSPAERVIDLLDRAVVAGQPLLQRIIRTEDKDLDQLLAELDADEALANKGLPPMQRPLVQSPNTLNVDMLSRISGVSPTRALLKGETDEGDWDADGEDDVKRLMEEWMRQGEKSRTTGRGRLWNRRQRRQMAQLLEQASTQGVPEESTTANEVEIDTSRIQALTKPDPTYLHDEKWFTTKPSIGLTQPLTHPRTHSIPVASLHFRSHHHHLLTFQTHFALHSAYMLGIPVSNPVHLPTQRTLVTVLRSPFVHKKSMENWERRTYKRVVKVWDCRSDVLVGWLAYLERNAVAGVGMRITRWEWVDMDMLKGGEGQEMKVKDYKEDAGKTDGPAVDLSSLESDPSAAIGIQLNTP